MNISGMVENISVNGIDHKQHKHNMIVDQGLETLCSMTTKTYSMRENVRCVGTLANDFLICCDDYNYTYYRAFPAVGCMFGTGSNATSVDQTALESPIGSVDDLDSFGFHRNDLSYNSSFETYNRYEEYEVHHLKYVWKATETATVKEIGIYSFLMPEEQISAGFTQSQSRALSNFTNRKLFSRCVLNTPVDVTKGDTVVVYYDVTVTAPHLPGSIVSTTDNIFGLPTIHAYAAYYDIYCDPSSKYYVQTINASYNTVNNDMSTTFHPTMLSDVYKLQYAVSANVTRSDNSPYLSCWNTPVSGTMRGSILNAYDIKNYRDSGSYRMISALGNCYNHNVFLGSTLQATSDGNSNTLHTVSNNFAFNTYINGRYVLYIVYNDHIFFLNSVLNESNEIIMSPVTIQQTCSLTFDITTTLNRG